MLLLRSIELCILENNRLKQPEAFYTTKIKRKKTLLRIRLYSAFISWSLSTPCPSSKGEASTTCDRTSTKRPWQTTVSLSYANYLLSFSRRTLATELLGLSARAHLSHALPVVWYRPLKTAQDVTWGAGLARPDWEWSWLQAWNALQEWWNNEDSCSLCVRKRSKTRNKSNVVFLSRFRFVGNWQESGAFLRDFTLPCWFAPDVGGALPWLPLRAWWSDGVLEKTASLVLACPHH